MNLTSLKFQLDMKSYKKILLAIALVSSSFTAISQTGSNNGEWASYAVDSGSTKYSSLAQISADNFEQLEIAWNWDSIDAGLDFGARADEFGFGRMQATPLMIDGVLYMITA